MEQIYWKYMPKLFDTHVDDKHVYATLFDELTPYLSQGTVKVFNNDYLERRLTTYFTTSDTKMEYSGRVLEIIKPHKNSYIESLFSKVNSEEFKKLIKDNYNIDDVDFNAVFINLYRSPQETNEPDYLGPHSDSLKYMKSEIILSVTYCEKEGARVFRFHEKGKSTKIVEQIELQDGDALFMLKGCQQNFKHSISNRKNSLDKKLITGGRINCTFRSVNS